jgi:hypothetical protein
VRSALPATKDFNADSREDLLWRNTQSGDVAIWLMNGAAVVQGPVVSSGAPQAWQISNVGDFDAADLLWRHTQR